MAVTLTPIPDIPMIRPGDDLAGLLIAACERNALAPADGDGVVVAQKIVSKAEGRYVDLAKVKPSPGAPICLGTSCASPKPDSPTRSPAPRRSSWGRGTRGGRRCWCAASPGRERRRPPPR